MQTADFNTYKFIQHVKCELQSTMYERQTTSCSIHTTHYKSTTTGSNIQNGKKIGIQATHYILQTTNYKLQITTIRIQTTRYIIQQFNITHAT